MRSDVRSRAGFLASSVLILGIAIAASVAIGGGTRAELILHFVLAGSFALIARAAFDFGLPAFFAAPVGVALAILAAIFLLQGLTDVTQSEALGRLAYGRLGQLPEKALGYVFLGWCAVLAACASQGRLRLFGIAALAAVFAAEIYTAIAPAFGATPSGLAKLLYVPVFVWLLLESRVRVTPERVGPASGSAI